MMLQDLFDDLSYGELSQISVGANTMAGICECDRPLVVSHIQLGLTQLYKRFKLKESCITLQLLAGKETYHLHRHYAVTALDSPIVDRYLLDTPEMPYNGTLMKVERVFNDRGTEMLLNKIGNPLSLYTVTDSKLTVPELARTEGGCYPATTKLKIWYRDNHPKIDMDAAVFSPDEVEIELPETHKWALLLFVASRYMNPVGMTNEFHAGSSYYAKFELACKELEGEGLQIDNVGQEHKFECRGFV